MFLSTICLFQVINVMHTYFKFATTWKAYNSKNHENALPESKSSKAGTHKDLSVHTSRHWKSADARVSWRYLEGTADGAKPGVCAKAERYKQRGMKPNLSFRELQAGLCGSS